MKKGALEVHRIQSWGCAMRGFLLLETGNTTRCKPDTINNICGLFTPSLHPPTADFRLKGSFLVSYFHFRVHWTWSRAGFSDVLLPFWRTLMSAISEKWQMPASLFVAPHWGLFCFCYNSSQVRYRGKCVLHTRERFTCAFSYML